MGTRGILAIAAACLALTACTSGDDASQDGLGDYGRPGALLEARADVYYYPACGNETLTVDGTAWYPFWPSNVADFPGDPLTDAGISTAVYLAEEAYLPIGVGGLGALGTSVPQPAAPPSIAPAGPGDDVGTFMLYENDLAYWESDSGDSHTWLTTEVIDFAWVCG